MSENTTSPEGRTYKYDAFISYRHLKPDAIIAEEIHKAIERFKVPKSLRKGGKAHDYRVFRDRDELATRDLSHSLDSALEDSEYLIVIASPRTPLSHWCTREVELFRRNHPDDHIIPVLVEGEPDESFSEPLKNLKGTRVNEKGDEEEVDLELLAADVRPEQVKSSGFVGYEALEKNGDPQFEELTKESVKTLKKSEIYRIMATMIGCSLGDLKQRHRERRMRIMAVVSTIIIVSLLIFGTFMTNMFLRATRAERVANEQISLMTMDYAAKANEQGNRAFALLVGNKAMETASEDMSEIDTIKSQHMTVMNDALFYDDGSTVVSFPVGNDSPFFALDHDSNWIITGSSGNDAVVWDLHRGGELRRLTFDAPVSSISVSMTEPLAAIGTRDSKIHFVDTNTWEYTSIDTDFLPINEMAFSGTGAYLLARVELFGIAIYDTKTGEESFLLELPFDKQLQNVSLSPTEDTFILATSDGEVAEYDMQTGSQSHVLIEAGSPWTEFYISTIAFSSDGSTVAIPITATTDDGEKAHAVRLFDTTTYEYRDLVDNNLGYVNSMSISPDGNYLYTIRDNNVYAYDINTLEYANRYEGEERVKLTGLSVSPDGTMLAAARDDNKVMFWYGIDDESATNIEPRIADSVGHGAPIISQRFTRDSSLYVTSSSDTTIRVAHIKGTLAEAEIEGNFLASSNNHQYMLLRSPDAGIAVFSWADWSLRDIPLNNEPASDSFVFWALSDDGSLVAKSRTDEHKAEIYNTKTGEVVSSTEPFETTSGPISLINSVQFYDNSARLLTSLLDTVRLSDVQTGETLQELTLKDGNIFEAYITPDGTYLGITLTDGTSVVFEVESENIVAELEGTILHMEVAEGELEFVTTDKDNIFYKWTPDGSVKQIAANSERKGIKNSTLNVDEVSNDGNYLITSTSENQLILTHIDTGERIRTFTSTNVYQSRGSFSPDGTYVAFDIEKDRMALVKLYNYEELLELSDEFLAGRTMSESELLSIGRSQ